MKYAAGLAVLFAACGPTTPAVVTEPAPPTTAGTPGTPGTPGEPDAAPDGVHLATGLTITGYDATLTVDPTQPTFSGSIKISATLDRARRDIFLHGHKLTITRAAVMSGGSSYGSTLAVTEAGSGRLRFTAEGEIPPGPVTLSIDYTGTINPTNTMGLFRQEAAGKWYAFTQLEALAGREVFPCLDEPSSKVPWTLSLIIPSGLVAVSNTPITADTADGANRRVTFATTPPLPSYLVAFAIGPFDVVDAGTTARGVPMKIYALAGRGHEAADAAAMTPKIVAWLEDWFGTPFPYPKLDAVAIPITVSFGAMENVGMITYRADLVLLPASAAESRRRAYASVAAHEISHQWFGDLVTPAWWDDIWLNESFATWLPPKVLASLYPDWITPTNVVEARDKSLWADSLGSARRIREPIRSEDDIFSAFDGITYGKGAAVLRMFEGYAGEEAFRRGVQSYLAAHAHGTATAADFLAAVSAATGTDVTTTMSTFLDQAGAPRLAATLTCEGDRARIAITQSRYLPMGAVATAAKPVWKLPVCVVYGAPGAKAGAPGARRQVCGLVAEPTAVLEGDGCVAGAWLYANAAGAGYYRTSIGDGLAALVRDGWRHLDPRERLAAAQDVQAAVVAGDADLADMLGLIPALVADSEHAALALAVEVLDSIRRFLPANDPVIARWIRTQLGPHARKLGWKPRAGESIHDSDLREHLVPLVAELGGDAALAKQAVALAKTWRAIPESIRGDAMRVAARARPALADAWRAEYVTETDRVRRRDLGRAIAQVADQAKVEAALALALDSRVDVRDAVEIVFNASRDPVSQPWAEAWLAANLDALIARLPTEGAAEVAWALAGGCDADRVAPLRAIADAKLVPLMGGPRTVEQAFEVFEQCVARRRVIEPSIATWRSTIK